MVHMHVGEDACHRKGMGDVGFTAAANLAEVGLLSKIIGTPNLLRLFGVQVAAQGGIKGINGLHVSTVTWLGAPG
jgi:hypothetical protein